MRDRESRDRETPERQRRPLPGDGGEGAGARVAGARIAEEAPGPAPEPALEAGAVRASGRTELVRGVVGLVLILAVIFGLLRLLHLVVPIFYPRVLSGPFSLEELAEVEDYAGFSVQVPFYRPEELGTRPVHITVTRRPRPRASVFWQGEHFLYLSERRGGRPPRSPPDARPLEKHPDALWWREGSTHHVQLQRDGLWIELRTDLGMRDVERLVETLRPYEDLL